MGPLQSIQRRDDGLARRVQAMQVNLCGLDALVAQQFLDVPDGRTRFQQVSGKTVTEHMGGYMFLDTGKAGNLRNRFAHRFIVNVNDQSLSGLGKAFQNQIYLALGQDDRKLLGFLGPYGTTEIARIFVKNVFIQIDNGIECLVLGRRSDMFVNSQVSQKGLNVPGIHIQRMPFVMKKDVTLDPSNVGSFRTERMFEANGIAELIE